MSSTRRYTRQQEAALRASLAQDEEAVCPRCGAKLERRPVPLPDAVSYVRRRDWYVCGECGGTLVVDRPR